MSVEKYVVEEQIAALGGFHCCLTWKERAYLHKVIAPGETLRALTEGFLEGSIWLVTVTDRRVLLLDKGFFYGLKQMEFPLSHISSVSYKTGLAFGRIQLFAAGGARRIEMVRKRDVPKVAHIVSSLIGRFRGPQHGPAADFVSQLERLAALKRSGILTEGEFALQKARLLQPV